MALRPLTIFSITPFRIIANKLLVNSFVGSAQLRLLSITRTYGTGLEIELGPLIHFKVASRYRRDCAWSRIGITLWVHRSWAGCRPYLLNVAVTRVSIAYT